MPVEILTVRALQVLDSRGNPTLEAEVELADGSRASAQVPSGASTGRHEARELRDAGNVYAGLGVETAVGHVNGPIAEALRGLPCEPQEQIDRRLIELDGTPDKSALGANATLGVSCALARAAALASGVPLWQHLSGNRRPKIPLPMVNILSGGLHARRGIEFQDFLAVPHGLGTFAEALEAAAGVHRSMAAVLEADGRATDGVADEGGWGPALESGQQALEYMVRAVEKAGYRPGAEVSIAIDAAATHFFADGCYRLDGGKRAVGSAEMIALYEGWLASFPIVSIEDPLAEDDWDGWAAACAALGERCALVGDDLLVTDLSRLRRAIADRSANAILVKMNQAGTLTETLQVVDLAAESGWGAVVSARSGETEDSFLADLAVAAGSGHIKVGSVTRSERLAKYNRLLRIEAGWDGALPEQLAPVRPLGHDGGEGGVHVNDA